MKICDNCKQQDGKHHEVGTVSLVVNGYHYNHHTHGNIPHSWTLDLCPACAKQLKEKIDATIKSLRRI